MSWDCTAGEQHCLCHTIGVQVLYRYIKAKLSPWGHIRKHRVGWRDVYALKARAELPKRDAPEPCGRTCIAVWALGLKLSFSHLHSPVQIMHFGEPRNAPLRHDHATSYQQHLAAGGLAWQPGPCLLARFQSPHCRDPCATAGTDISPRLARHNGTCRQHLLW